MQTTKRSLKGTTSNSSLNKKLKTNDSVQSNTLYKYFESNKKPPTPPPKQSSLLSFFKRETSSSSVAVTSNTTTDNDEKTNETIKPSNDAFAKLMNPIKVEKKELDENASETTSVFESDNSKSARKCPFYKRIEGTM
jgi:hypothetical protein